MKAFLISSCLIILIFSLTIFNGIYIINVTNSLIKEAESLTLDIKSIEKFHLCWRKHQSLIKLSSSHKETHRIDELLCVMQENAKANIYNNFYEDRALLIEYLKQIQEDETVSFDSII